MDKKSSESKKLVPIYLIELFWKKSDETHFIKMSEILLFLEKKNVYVDRRTVYSAISVLNSAGFEIEGIQEKGSYKYRLTNRTFTSNELKFLVDSVTSSKFLTTTKSQDLIKKIASLGTQYDKDLLNRNVLISERVKTMNNKVLKNLDTLYSAISGNFRITFKYVHWNEKRELISKKKDYNVSPYAVHLTDDNYYLVAFESQTQTLRHYRIDKMKNIELTEETREGIKEFRNFDIAEYSRKTFGMFNGQERSLSIQCKKELVGVFIDRFGDNVNIRPDYDNTDCCIVGITVYTSPQFYAWIFALGSDVTILQPQSAIDEFREMINTILENYNRNNR